MPISASPNGSTTNATTYSQIATYTTTTNLSSYTFSPISSAYTHLEIVVSPLVNSSLNNIRVQFNGDSTNGNYAWVQFTYDGGTPRSNQSQSDSSVIISNDTDTTIPGIAVCRINNYRNTSFFKSTYSKWGTTLGVGTFIGTWKSTSAITSITFFSSSGDTLKAGTTFTIYGILEG